MVDLETMGSGPDANSLLSAPYILILQLVTLVPEFYRVVSLESSMSFGMGKTGCVNNSVVDLKQSSEARSAILVDEGRGGCVKPLNYWLTSLLKILLTVVTVQLWGNGCSFDNVILPRISLTETPFRCSRSGMAGTWDHG